MFSFHKPKIYRSLHGCCICRAKSSSSRFTDSKRYEEDFEKCFRINHQRSGEICNACVLLVKRWKKLPPGSNRNWHHVVDARAGPGSKSIVKIKTDKFKKKHIKKQKHRVKPKQPRSPGGLSDDILFGDDCISEKSLRNSPSPNLSDVSEDSMELPPSLDSTDIRGRRHRHRRPPTKVSSFLDLNFWKKTEVCCGIIFKGPNGEVLLDRRLLRPCRSCKPVVLPEPIRQAAVPPTISPLRSQEEIDLENAALLLEGVQALAPSYRPWESQAVRLVSPLQVDNMQYADNSPKTIVSRTIAMEA